MRIISKYHNCCVQPKRWNQGSKDYLKTKVTSMTELHGSISALFNINHGIKSIVYLIPGLKAVKHPGKTKTCKRKAIKLVGGCLQSMIKTLIIQNQQLNHIQNKTSYFGEKNGVKQGK